MPTWLLSFRDWCGASLSTDSVFDTLSFAAPAAALIVVLGLFLEYERDELRIFRRVNVANLNAGKTFQARRVNVFRTKNLGAVLVIVGVTLESLLTTALSGSAIIREGQNKRQIADLQSDNLALETLIQPREVGIDGGPNSKEAALRKFPRACVYLQYANDLETEKLTGELMWVFKDVGWQVKQVDEIESGMDPLSHDGVLIIVHEWEPISPTPLQIIQNQTFDAASALDTYFKHFDVTSHTWQFIKANPLKFDLPPNCMFVFVGMKPLSEEIRKRKWLEQMPEDARQWFESIEREEKR